MLAMIEADTMLSSKFIVLHFDAVVPLWLVAQLIPLVMQMAPFTLDDLMGEWKYATKAAIFAQVG